MKTDIYSAFYKGETVRVITVLLDLDVAFIENSSGELLSVEYSKVLY